MQTIAKLLIDALVNLMRDLIGSKIDTTIRDPQVVALFRSKLRLLSGILATLDHVLENLERGAK